MSSKINIFTFLIILTLIYSCSESTGPNDDLESFPSKDTLAVLFIGSSYFSYNNLVGLMTNLADSSGKHLIIGNGISSGYLYNHASSIYTEEKINERNWDYVVLQGVGRITAYPDIYKDNPVYPSLVTLQEKILKNCSSTKMVFCMPWAYEDGMTWLQGWTDDYSDMQQHIYNNTMAWVDSLNFIIAPVGWSWKTVLTEKDFPLHYLHMSDWNHPSLRGSYLMACTIYSTIFTQVSTGIRYYGNLSKEEAEYFQEVASNTVLKNPEKWNIRNP